MKYKVLLVQEVCINARVEIEANSPEEAEQLATDKLENGDYADDFALAEGQCNYDVESWVHQIEDAQEKVLMQCR